MERKLTKTIFSNLKPEQIITINFVNGKGGGNIKATKKDAREMAPSGNFKVMELRKGRGRTGSRLVTIMSVTDGTIVEIGTPFNNEIADITIDGNLFSDEKRVDSINSDKLKTAFSKYIGIAPKSKMIDVSSVSEEFNGTWFILAAKKNSGVGGQISILLESPDGTKTTTIWSRRHSAFITNIEEVE